MGEQNSGVSEEEYQRLQRDYTDATEQFAAPNEVLTRARSTHRPIRTRCSTR